MKQIKSLLSRSISIFSIPSLIGRRNIILVTLDRLFKQYINIRWHDAARKLKHSRSMLTNIKHGLSGNDIFRFNNYNIKDMVAWLLHTDITQNKVSMRDSNIELELCGAAL